MGMTRREFRGLVVLAALLAIIVGITAITQCRRSNQRTDADACEPATTPCATADSTPATGTNVVGHATEGDSAIINFHPTLQSGAAQGNSKQFPAKKRANLKATKQKPGRKVKPMQPDRKSPLESPVKPDGAQ